MIGGMKLCLVALTTILMINEISGNLEITKVCPEGETKGSFSYNLTNNLNREVRVSIKESVDTLENKEVLLNNTNQVTIEAGGTKTGRTTNIENSGPGMLTFYYRVSVSGDLQFTKHTPCVLKKKPTEQPGSDGSLIHGSLLLLLISLLTFMFS
ncbi:unnamed protein product [Owenia fusiformis]|uniref:Uncharacterized protein n=1 Tax=Owenia fusiformis TaxID=6347 RepID=A0A8J1TQL8_OWEFU|nr:unnamed protein product [Owenia fusiformis]